MKLLRDIFRMMFGLRPACTECGCEADALEGLSYDVGLGDVHQCPKCKEFLDWRGRPITHDPS